MICCVNCFHDPQLRSIVKSLKRTGDCSLCGSRSVFIYDTDQDDTLVQLFDDLLDIYTPIDVLPLDYPKEKTSLLRDDLCDRWNIFNLEKEQVYRLVVGICKERYRDTPELFDSPVGIPQLFDEDYIAEHSLLRTSSWEQFVTSIRTETRFHTKAVNTDVLSRFCSYAKKTLKQGATFYRARISSELGFPPEKMGAPPHAKAVAGRANPEGISYLYLSNNMATTLKEIRAGAHDYVSVGTFVLSQDINIVDLTAIDQISAFSIQDRTEHALNKPHLRKISSELARPLRRFDSPLDYLPTQYICDFISSVRENGQREYAGIQYKSTRSRGGYNLTVFDPSVFQCVSVTVVDIKDLVYQYDELPNI